MMPRCAWCRRPAIGFVAYHPHCGRSHILKKIPKKKLATKRR